MGFRDDIVNICVDSLLSEMQPVEQLAKTSTFAVSKLSVLKLPELTKNINLNEFSDCTVGEGEQFYKHAEKQVSYKWVKKIGMRILAIESGQAGHPSELEFLYSLVKDYKNKKL